MAGLVIGYARGGKAGQRLGVQIRQLKACACQRIFKEGASDVYSVHGGACGIGPARPQLRRMLNSIRSGDTVAVTRIARLADSVAELFDIIQAMTAKNVKLLSLAEPWADTASGAGSSMLLVLGGLAEAERDMARMRDLEGRSSIAAPRLPAFPMAAPPGPGGRRWAPRRHRNIR